MFFQIKKISDILGLYILGLQIGLGSLKTESFNDFFYINKVLKSQKNEFSNIKINIKNE